MRFPHISCMNHLLDNYQTWYRGCFFIPCICNPFELGGGGALMYCSLFTKSGRLQMRNVMCHGLKVCHSSNFLFKSFVEKYFPQQSLKQKTKQGVSVHLSEQQRYKDYLFALNSDFCIICFIHINIMLYFMMTITVVLFNAKSENKSFD